MISYNGEELKKKYRYKYTYIWVTKSLCDTPEPVITMQINFSSKRSQIKIEDSLTNHKKILSELLKGRE